MFYLYLSNVYVLNFIHMDFYSLEGTKDEKSHLPSDPMSGLVCLYRYLYPSAAAV